MWRLIWLLLILIVSIFVGLSIAKDPGLAFFSYKNWSVEMPLWFAAVSFLAVMFILYLILRFSDGISNTFYGIKNWFKLRRKNIAYSKTNRGLLDLIEGSWKNAEYNLLAGIKDSKAKLINYLGLAKASHEQGKYEKRDKYLKKAHMESPQSEMSIGLTKANLQLKQGKLDEALATLNHLDSKYPKQAAILKLLERVYVHTADWQNLLDLMPKLYRAGIVNREQYAILEKNTFKSLLKSLSKDNVESVHDLWKKLPRNLQSDPDFIFYYAEKLLGNEKAAPEVEYLVNRALKKSWHAGLASLYGKIRTEDIAKQLTHAEKLIRHYKDHPEIYLSAGILSEKCKLWGKARGYFEESLKLQPTTESYAHLAKLLDKLGDQAGAIDNYKSAIELTS